MINKQAQAIAAARLGERLIEEVRAGHIEAVEGLLVGGGSVARSVRLFGLALLRLDLRLDDPREAGQLRPYDLQIEADLAFLELGVVSTTPGTAGERGHLTRLFGSGVLLRPALASEYGWLIEEVLPVNADGELGPTDPTDALILKTYQGLAPLPLRLERLDAVERAFLAKMASAGRFNLEELFNATRLWEDYRASEPEPDPAPPEWAAAIEYLISVFDYHQDEPGDLTDRYGVASEAVLDRARELAATLRVTQFDDRYSIHSDPIEHYRQLFGELGIDPRRDEEVRQANANQRIFDTVEVAPDDEDFFGPPARL